MKRISYQVETIFTFVIFIISLLSSANLLAKPVVPPMSNASTANAAAAATAARVTPSQLLAKRILTDDVLFAQQKNRSENLLIQILNIPGIYPGTIVASPSQVAPNYFYHWIRDAAVGFMQVQSIYLTNGGAESNSLQAWMMAHLSLNLKFQAIPNLMAGIGEPKFNSNGTAFQGPWGRPQTDGPALRAISFIYFLNRIVRENWPNRNQIVASLYDSKLPTHSLIKTDLEYVAHNWQIATFDLWEESFGAHFFTLMVQRRAMIEGSRVAEKFGDLGAAKFYAEQAQRIAQSLQVFWNSNANYIMTSVNVRSGPRKTNLIDSSVLMAALYGDIGDGYYAPYDDRILASLQVMKESFQKLYPINQNTKVGVALGRYPDDTYDGVSTNGIGNPWFIANQAAAEIYYRTSLQLSRVKRLQISQINLRFYTALMQGQMKFTPGQILTSSEPAFAQIVRQLFVEGDRELEVTIVHRGADGSLSEQFNRTSGYMQGAVNLTWSHASFLSAVSWRNYIRSQL